MNTCLVAGTLLTPGKRAGCAALRAMGLNQGKHFARYHRVLNRARWSSRAVSRVLLGRLVATFAPTGPIILGLDEPSARRHPPVGTRPQIAAKGL